MKLKYKIGQTVKIDVCDIVGMIVNILMSPKECKYLISYPDVDGRPVEKYFYDMELSLAEEYRLGFASRDICDKLEMGGVK